MIISGSLHIWIAYFIYLLLLCVLSHSSISIFVPLFFAANSLSGDFFSSHDRSTYQFLSSLSICSLASLPLLLLSSSYSDQSGVQYHPSPVPNRLHDLSTWSCSVGAHQLEVELWGSSTVHHLLVSDHVARIIPYSQCSPLLPTPTYKLGAPSRTFSSSPFFVTLKCTRSFSTNFHNV